MLLGVHLKGEGSMDPPHCQAKVHTTCLNHSLVHNLHKLNSNRSRTLYLQVDKLFRLNNDHRIQDNNFNTLSNINILLKCNIICNNKCQGFMDNTQTMLQQRL